MCRLMKQSRQTLLSSIGYVFTLVVEPGIDDIWFKVEFDLEGKDQSLLPNTIGILMKMFCILYIWEIIAWVRGCGTGKC